MGLAEVSVGASSVLGLDVGVGVASVLTQGVRTCSLLRLGVGVGVVVGVEAAVAACRGIWFKMRPRSARYHALTCSSIVDMSAAIKNALAVFLVFAAT